MLSFIICFALLIGGYFVYGKIVENTFAPDDRETPAVRINDGVDYVVMPQWKLFLVQLLNIAGLVPSLQVVYMIISQVCFLKEIMAHLFLRYVVSILEVR